jgi:hypothetical protein
MAIRNIGKLPKRKVTVDELLGNDTIANIADTLYQERENVESCCLIIYHKDGSWSSNWMGTGSQICWAMDCFKQTLINGDE